MTFANLFTKKWRIISTFSIEVADDRRETVLNKAVAYKMIEGEKTEFVPQIEANRQKQMLYERLGGEYSHSDLADEAKRQGISKRTVERWNLKWIESGLVEKTTHGRYRKIA